ncbi:hypothetical protein G6F23_015025 [Rhizopus arrhizus]|nr:hypothetical protein G6F23_015025 [Rhizopus arrhizus]
MGGNGSPDAHAGVGIHLYAANRDMVGRYFYDADGELLIVPQLGALRLLTEMGVIEIEPQQIAPRLHLRELRRAAEAARPRPDRLQRPGQPTRLRDPACGIRGRGR